MIETNHIFGRNSSEHVCWSWLPLGCQFSIVHAYYLWWSQWEIITQWEQVDLHLHSNESSHKHRLIKKESPTHHLHLWTITSQSTRHFHLHFTFLLSSRLSPSYITTITNKTEMRHLKSSCGKETYHLLAVMKKKHYCNSQYLPCKSTNSLL